MVCDGDGAQNWAHFFGVNCAWLALRGLEMVSIVVLAYRKKCPCQVLDRFNSCSRTWANPKLPAATIGKTTLDFIKASCQFYHVKEFA